MGINPIIWNSHPKTHLSPPTHISSLLGKEPPPPEWQHQEAPAVNAKSNLMDNDSNGGILFTERYALVIYLIILPAMIATTTMAPGARRRRVSVSSTQDLQYMDADEELGNVPISISSTSSTPGNMYEVETSAAAYELYHNSIYYASDVPKKKIIGTLESRGVPSSLIHSKESRDRHLLSELCKAVKTKMKSLKPGCTPRSVVSAAKKLKRAQRTDDEKERDNAKRRAKAAQRTDDEKEHDNAKRRAQRRAKAAQRTDEEKEHDNAERREMKSSPRKRKRGAQRTNDEKERDNAKRRRLCAQRIDDERESDNAKRCAQRIVLQVADAKK